MILTLLYAFIWIVVTSIYIHFCVKYLFLYMYIYIFYIYTSISIYIHIDIVNIYKDIQRDIDRCIYITHIHI